MKVISGFGADAIAVMGIGLASMGARRDEFIIIDNDDYWGEQKAVEDRFNRSKPNQRRKLLTAVEDNHPGILGCHSEYVASIPQNALAKSHGNGKSKRAKRRNKR